MADQQDTTPAPSEPVADRYFKLDGRNLTFREHWNITRSPRVILPWTAKLLRLSIRFGSGMAFFESIREFEVTEARFSPIAYRKLLSSLEKCLRMGFQSPRFFTYESLRRDSRVSFIAMPHPTGVAVQLIHSLSGSAERLVLLFLNELSDGTFFATSDQPQRFNSTPGITVNRVTGAGPERLLESHLQKLEALAERNPAKLVTTPEELDGLWDRYEKKLIDHGFQRGIYVWMTPKEVAAEERVAVKAGPVPGH